MHEFGTWIVFYDWKLYLITRKRLSVSLGSEICRHLSSSSLFPMEFIDELFVFNVFVKNFILFSISYASLTAMPLNLLMVSIKRSASSSLKSQFYAILQIGKMIVSICAIYWMLRRVSFGFEFRSRSQKFFCFFFCSFCNIYIITPLFSVR